VRSNQRWGVPVARAHWEAVASAVLQKWGVDTW
jgi:hypothetical protein